MATGDAETFRKVEHPGGPALDADAVAQRVNVTDGGDGCLSDEEEDGDQQAGENAGL